ncbi:MAG: acetate--CoA ligase family protein [Crenarchaeota archaeon]|nr:acetate--CoA ligase family protein [Thermoproteota archaeon]
MSGKSFQRILNYASATGSKVIPEHLVKPFLVNHGITVPSYVIVKEPSDLKRAGRLQFPVVLKVSSNRFVHKTDVEGVLLNIRDSSELKRSAAAFRKRFGAEPLLVEEMVDGGVEAICGLIHDEDFGMCIMIGIGGIYAEIYRDVSIRVLPISKADVLEMISELKGKKLFEGFRNIRIDKAAFTELVLKFSAIGEKYGKHILGLDANPVILGKNYATVVDAKMILK